jgi:hypothetical protein
MDYPKQEEKKKGKYSKDEFKKDVEDAVVKGVKSAKPRKKKGKKSSKYAALSTKELHQMVSGKRDLILQKKGIPKKIPRGRAALEALCKKMRLK